MHLTRAGYNGLVIIWLIPIIFADLFGNTVNTGVTSDLYYYKFMADCLLAMYALYQCFRGQTASLETARARVSDHKDDVMSFENIGAAEYIYCAVLVVYAAFNWYELHSLNTASTGTMSLLTLVWSFVSLAVIILSAVQFWNLKSGKIVALKKSVLQ